MESVLHGPYLCQIIDSTWSPDRSPVSARVRGRAYKQQTPLYAVLYLTGQSFMIGEPYEGSVV